MRYAILGLIALCAIMVSVDDVQASGFGGQRAIVVDRDFGGCNRGPRGRDRSCRCSGRSLIARSKGNF